MDDVGSFALKGDTLSVEVTTACNSCCSHCFVRARGPRRSTLDPNLVRTIVREAYAEGYRHLHVTGGEPLMWDGLHRLFDYAFSMGYQTVFLNTNGTLLSAEESRKLAQYFGLTISISIQGPKRLHDNMRGKGSYDQALKGIDNAMQAGLPVHVFTPVGKSLLPELPKFAADVLSAFPDIKELNLIQLIRVPEDAFDLSREVLNPDDFLKLVRVVALLYLYGLKVDLLRNPLAVVASRVLGMKWLPSATPLYQRGSIMISAEQRVTLAHSTINDFGIYQPGTISKILRSTDYGRAVSPDESTCGKCDYLPLCRMEGMTRPSEWFRDMFPQVPYCMRVLAKASSYG